MVLWAGEGPRQAAYELLAALLRAEYGMEEMPETARSGTGKPWFPARLEVCFSVSHSGGLVLCGAGAAPLGVDIERMRPRRAGLARYVLSGEEYRWYEGRGGRWEDLYSLWTLKEARCKCAGTGLDRPARTIAVPLLEPGQAGTLDGLSFRAYGGAGWRAAACAAALTPLPERLEWCSGADDDGWMEKL